MSYLRTAEIVEQWMAALNAGSASEKGAILQTIMLPSDGATWDMPTLPARPGRPVGWSVSPPLPRRRRTLTHEPTRNRFLLAMHNIELSAIDLAVVGCLRASGAPSALHADFMRIALDEVRHAQLLEKTLHERGVALGSDAVHFRLWETTLACADFGEHVVAIPRFLEARGLDVSADILPRLQALDPVAHQVLSIIYHDEIIHVEIGSRWHQWWCAEHGETALAHFQRVVEKHFPGQVPGPTPLDAAGRAQAGFTGDEMSWLTAGQRLPQRYLNNNNSRRV
jgi:uncharacterized ferritin-like protein (DUF455 family)